eukprot:158793-Chlamydomonas_euryale.AAC.4
MHLESQPHGRWLWCQARQIIHTEPVFLSRKVATPNKAEWHTEAALQSTQGRAVTHCIVDDATHSQAGLLCSTSQPAMHRHTVG